MLMLLVRACFAGEYITVYSPRTLCLSAMNDSVELTGEQCSNTVIQAVTSGCWQEYGKKQHEE